MSKKHNFADVVFSNFHTPEKQRQDYKLKQAIEKTVCFPALNETLKKVDYENKKRLHG